MTQYRETTKKDWIKTIVYIAVFVALLVIGAILLLPAYWYIWLILVIVGLFFLVRWHAKQFAYRCANCECEFEISTFTDLISPHGVSGKGGWKYLKCPNCHQRTKAIVIKK